MPRGGVTRKRRCTYRPSVIYLIVNKLLSLSLSLSLLLGTMALMPEAQVYTNEVLGARFYSTTTTVRSRRRRTLRSSRRWRRRHFGHSSGLGGPCNGASVCRVVVGLFIVLVGLCVVLVGLFIHIYYNGASVCMAESIF